MAAGLPGLLLMSFSPLTRRQIPTTMAAFWRMGIGDLEPYTFLYIFLPVADPAGLVANILVANAPQLVLSLFYMAYNALLTTYLVQREFSRLARGRALRVSEPAQKGGVPVQRSSYTLSLPLRYGVPLQASSAVMNWLVSQSLFLARIEALNPDGSPNAARTFSTCGYSPMAVILSEWAQPSHNALLSRLTRLYSSVHPLHHGCGAPLPGIRRV